jgi:hypothetical protein
MRVELSVVFYQRSEVNLLASSYRAVLSSSGTMFTDSITEVSLERCWLDRLDSFHIFLPDWSGLFARGGKFRFFLVQLSDYAFEDYIITLLLIINNRNPLK